MLSIAGSKKIKAKKRRNKIKNCAAEIFSAAFFWWLDTIFLLCYTKIESNTEPSGTPTVYNYTYGNNYWKDQLTAYNGNQITYDANGNPLTNYDGFTFAWNGRQLVRATNSAYTVTFTYNEAGLRQTKTVDGITTTYNYNGSLLLSEQNSERIILYMYDGNGSLIGFMCCMTADVDEGNHNFDVYYYEKNLQGDVIAVRDENGAVRYSYLYNAWGELVYAYAHNGAENTTARYNTIFYRGYYFDEDLCLYYLNTRYYDDSHKET